MGCLSLRNTCATGYTGRKEINVDTFEIFDTLEDKGWDACWILLYIAEHGNDENPLDESTLNDFCNRHNIV